jgi:uncharacterized membrane protein YdfJ with MMPL/SSD domain
MFLRWGHLLAVHRRLVLVLAALSLVASIAGLVLIRPELQQNALVSDEAESMRVAAQLADRFGRGDNTIVFLIDADGPIADPATTARVAAALAPLTPDRGVVGVISAANTGSPDFVSRDGSSTYALALIDANGVRNSAKLVTAVEDSAAAQGLRATATGATVVNDDVTLAVERGLVRAEIIAIPLTILFLVLIFGGLVAAGLPLITGAIGIVATLAITCAISFVTPQSVFAFNLVTMLGLGLGVDYSLFMVSRFREELARRPVEEAIAVTVATVGKAVFFSAITVMFGLSATLFFPMPTIAQMGQAGVLVVGMALVYGLTFLPALLAVLGHRVNRFAVRRPAVGPRDGFWHALAATVMRRPVVFLVPIMVVLLIMSIPLLGLNLTPGTINIVGRDSPSRLASERLQSEFTANAGNTIPVIVTAADGDALSAASVAAETDLAHRIAAIPGVTGVDGLTTGALAAAVPYDWSAYAGDPATLPLPLRRGLPALVDGDATLMEVSFSTSPTATQAIVGAIRDLRVGGVTAAVGGDAALNVDVRDGIIDALPGALLFVFVGSYLILLLSFGSVLLPVKAIFMTLLSITSSLGIVVLVFQQGYGADLLGFTADGQLIATTPILMFCVLWGLSMDYEVLLLSRVQEEYVRTGRNRESVAAGIEHTGGIITGAAAIMIVVFGGFVIAEVTVIKSLGFGLAVAVLIDATIVRCLLVPATMRLLGRWNWWAPVWIHRGVDRLGFGPTELPAPPPSATPAD